MPSDMSNLREDGSFPPAFDHVAIVDGDRVQQPGTLLRDPRSFPQNIEREAMKSPVPTKARASDKFAVRAFIVPDLHAHQLLPVDPDRKVAHIQTSTQVGNGYGIFIGTQTDVESFAGTQGAIYRVAPNLIWIPGVNVAASSSAFLPYDFTSKAALYYCAVATIDAATTGVQMLVETFDSGTPVT